MKTLIDDFQIFPGDHCGSVAMRGLLNHYCNLELPEPAVFGLGAGIASVYLSGPDLDPAAILFGRTPTMEQDLANNLQLDYREQTEPDDDEAWRVVREEVLAGSPTMLSGDIFYLDYREFKVHFPGHRFVLLGFEDETEQAFIADRMRPEPEICSSGAVRCSRNAPEGWRVRDRNHGPTRPVTPSAPLKSKSGSSACSPTRRPETLGRLYGRIESPAASLSIRSKTCRATRIERSAWGTPA